MEGPFKIVEGISGMWHYHLAHEDSNGLTSLCGKQTMPTRSRLETWGFKPGHYPTSYCEECEKIACGESA